MGLKLRLARGGAKKRPFYRIVVADVRAPRDGRYIEKIGTYNPLLPKDAQTRVVLDKERAEYWLSKGALPTDRVLRFLAAEGIMKRDARNNPNKGKPGQKTQDRLEAQAQAKADAEAKPEAPAEAEQADAEQADAEQAGADQADAPAPA